MADEERDTSCWLGNVMQREAFNKLYSVAGRVHYVMIAASSRTGTICRQAITSVL